MIEEIIKRLQQMRMSSEQFAQINDVAKKLLSSDPKALDGNITEHFIRDRLGDPAYLSIRKMYHEFIGYHENNNKNRSQNNNQSKNDYSAHKSNNKNLLGM